MTSIDQTILEWGQRGVEPCEVWRESNGRRREQEAIDPTDDHEIS